MAMASWGNVAWTLRPRLLAAWLSKGEHAVGPDHERRLRCLGGQGLLPRRQVGWREAAKGEGQPLPPLLSLQEREPGSGVWVVKQKLRQTSSVHSELCLHGCKLFEQKGSNSAQSNPCSAKQRACQFPNAQEPSRLTAKLHLGFQCLTSSQPRPTCHSRPMWTRRRE